MQNINLWQKRVEKNIEKDWKWRGGGNKEKRSLEMEEEGLGKRMWGGWNLFRCGHHSRGHEACSSLPGPPPSVEGSRTQVCPSSPVWQRQYSSSLALVLSAVKWDRYLAQVFTWVPLSTHQETVSSPLFTSWGQAPRGEQRSGGGGEVGRGEGLQPTEI